MKACGQQSDSKTRSAVAATRPQQSLHPMDGPQKKGPRAAAAHAPAPTTPDGLAAAPKAEEEGKGQTLFDQAMQEPEQRPDPTAAPPEQGQRESKTLPKTEPSREVKSTGLAQNSQVDPAV